MYPWWGALLLLSNHLLPCYCSCWNKLTNKLERGECCLSAHILLSIATNIFAKQDVIMTRGDKLLYALLSFPQDGGAIKKFQMEQKGYGE